MYVNPVVLPTAAGPLMPSWPYYYGGGLYSRGFGRWGVGSNYGTGWSGSWYNPYGYMSGTYWREGALEVGKEPKCGEGGYCRGVASGVWRIASGRWTGVVD
jgi:hypothetical protein